MDLSFWKGKRVFLTGHTGFKGSWLCRILVRAGAVVTGYSLAPDSDSNLFSICAVENKIDSIIGDIRDNEKLKHAFIHAQPEIVIHMAAQPLVRKSYQEPAYTYEVNVMGTINILESTRLCTSVKSFLNVTTDKVYRNNEWEWGYRESDQLGGHDPYSSSKSCSELITQSYNSVFFPNTGVSTARAGNVIGGGDFAADRIIPDCVRAAIINEPIIVRNPRSIRPYQHVLEPLFAYLLIAQKQYDDIKFASNYNVGPDDCDCVSTGTLVDIFCTAWGDGASWKNISDSGPHEATFLKLDCSKIKSKIGWMPRWNVKNAIEKTVEWTKVFINHKQDIPTTMDNQILEFLQKKDA